MTVTSLSGKEPIRHRKSAQIESHDSSSPDLWEDARSIDINLLWILFLLTAPAIGTRRCSARQEAKSFRAACGSAIRSPQWVGTGQTEVISGAITITCAISGTVDCARRRTYSDQPLLPESFGGTNPVRAALTQRRLDWHSSNWRAHVHSPTPITQAESSSPAETEVMTSSSMLLHLSINSYAYNASAGISINV
jgi:hypothetical protein